MPARHERRRSVRINADGVVSGHVLGRTGIECPFSGTIVDISERGLGVQSSNVEPDDALIQCRVKLPNLPSTIPTLAEVRWSKPFDKEFRVGLQFVLD